MPKLSEVIPDIRKVSSKFASKVIENKVPLGLFYREGNGNFIGIDNSTGDAWVEEFDTQEKCFAWLKGEEFNLK